jgi:predicted nucleic-acid-binding Zn-ribbon protein
MVSANKDEDSDHDNNNSSNKCPKCLSGDMIVHPLFLSMPLTSLSKITEKSKTAIEDQDADFVFKFISCRNCGYSEFFLITNDIRRRM